MHKKTHKPVVVLSVMIMLLLLLFDISAQTASSNRFKRIDYEYDLISGNVNKVMYQKDSADQFVHQYDYDSDNRITKVLTSNDNVTWDVEAKYFYYAHGPLARTEYGDINNQVQGVDYAYTLQGWIKGVNSNTLDKNRDMGQDGLENEIYDPAHPQLHSNIAKDAFGYSLNYFKNDYKAIGYLRWSSVANRFEASTNGSDLMNSRNDLFNGNISSMITTIVKPTITTGNTYDFTPLPQGAAYKFDQLNRLVEMKAWQNLNSVNNTWGTGLAYNGLYNNKFTFDANGNILTQLRKDETGVAINDLSYRRFNLASKTMQNRLYMVDDAVSNTVFTDDIDDQGTFDNSTYANVKTNNNYGYDEIGNMNRNNQKQIAQIKYTVYGKVKEVVRASGSIKKNLKFDYDASGNRIAKHVYSSSNVWEKSEYYVVDAQGNVMSVYKHEATGTTPPISFAQIERNIYGSSRIGVDKTNKELIAAYTPNGNLNHVLGNKQYDGVNHLGNVLVTFTNKRISIDADNNNIIDEYWPEVVSSNDYYPFGVKMKNRSFSSSNNRYQFNGKQYDDETETSDFGARNLDEDLGSWLTIDPLSIKYPDLSPYNFVANNPIIAIDPDGEKIIVVEKKGFLGIGRKTVVYEPGKGYNGNSQYAKEVFASLDYNIKVGKGEEIEKIANDDNVKLTIKNQKLGKSPFFKGTGEHSGILKYNPHSGFENEDDNGNPTGEFIAPARLAKHEIDHADNYFYDREAMDIRLETPDPLYHNLEEKNVIEKENNDKLPSEPTRTNHFGREKIFTTPLPDNQPLENANPTPKKIDKPTNSGTKDEK